MGKFNSILTALKGGKGSGNFAHLGRPGKVGGSISGGRSFAIMDWQEYRASADTQNRGYSTINVPRHIEAESEEFFDYMMEHGLNADALKQYSDFSASVNFALRNGTPLSNRDERIVKFLDEYFDHKSSKAPRDMIVYRGGIPKSVREGSTFTDKGYVSTSTEYASNFGEVVAIKVPKGSRVIFNTYSGENEVLLPRNSSFRKQADGTWLLLRR